jgi:hypothetical protein
MTFCVLATPPSKSPILRLGARVCTVRFKNISGMRSCSVNVADSKAYSRSCSRLRRENRLNHGDSLISRLPSRLSLPLRIDIMYDRGAVAERTCTQQECTINKRTSDRLAGRHKNKDCYATCLYNSRIRLLFSKHSGKGQHRV